MEKNTEGIIKMLREPFPIHEIKWRIGRASKGGRSWAMILCYIDARAVMDRLDDVLGPENWQDHYTTAPSGGNMCQLTCRIGGEWITKSDAAENTDVEGIKGGISDAFKRAAVKFGPGRYLYSIGTTWAEISDSQTTACPEKHSKDGNSFWWGPPRSAYKKLGYSDDEIASLPFFGGKPDAGREVVSRERRQKNDDTDIPAEFGQFIEGVAGLIRPVDVIEQRKEIEKRRYKWKQDAVAFCRALHDVLYAESQDALKRIYDRHHDKMGLDEDTPTKTHMMSMLQMACRSQLTRIKEAA
jgi:hypothetical protein